MPLLTGKQLNDWMEYYAVEPWGCDVDDMRALVAAGGDAEKCLSHWARRPAPEPTPEEVAATLQGMFG